MNRGIEVEFADSDESLLFLRDVAKIIDENDKVYISLLDFVGGHKDGNIENVTYNKRLFIKQIEKIDQLLFLELSVFSGDVAICNSIIDYESFVKSSCKIVVLCSDSAYFDIYIKDPKALTALYDYCKARSYCNLEMITDKNDGRSVFSVL